MDIRFVGSFFLKGERLLPRQFFRKFKVFTDIYPRLSRLKPKYALENTQKEKRLPAKCKCYLRMVLATESSLSPSGEEGLVLVRSGAGWSLRSAAAFSGLDLPITSNRSDRY